MPLMADTLAEDRVYWRRKKSVFMETFRWLHCKPQDIWKPSLLAGCFQVQVGLLVCMTWVATRHSERRAQELIKVMLWLCWNFLICQIKKHQPLILKPLQVPEPLDP